jgi:hypothetical protein
LAHLPNTYQEILQEARNEKEKLTSRKRRKTIRVQQSLILLEKMIFPKAS